MFYCLMSYDSRMDTMKQSFPPLINVGCNILVLGTLPGEDSLKFQQYYGHPRNQFWQIMGDIWGHSFTAMAYRDKCQLLLEHRVGLWDTLRAAERQGSLDSRIRKPQLNDISALLHDYPTINKICFNGKQARRYFKTHENHVPSTIKLFDLPSTSPAYTRAYAEKLAVWQSAFDASS